MDQVLSPSLAIVHHLLSTLIIPLSPIYRYLVRHEFQRVHGKPCYQFICHNKVPVQPHKQVHIGAITKPPGWPDDMHSSSDVIYAISLNSSPFVTMQGLKKSGYRAPTPALTSALAHSTKYN